MTTTPYAKATMKIDGTPAVSGGQLVGGGNVIQLLGESTVNWNNQLWQIYEYPVGFALPLGWTNNNGIYECSLVVPPTFTIDTRATRWGKYLIRLIVNNGLLAGVYAGPGSVQPLVDVASALETKSPNLGLTDVAFMETNQFDPIRQWIGELKATLRVIDTAVGSGVATPPGGSNGQVQYNAGGSFGGLPVLKWDSVSSRVVASSGGLEVSNPGGTFGYSIVGSALAADRILTLPLLTGNDTVVSEAFAQTLTNKTFNVSNNSLIDTGASLGDLLYFNGTKYVRFARGSVGQVLTATNTSIAWQPVSSINTITEPDWYVNTSSGNDTNDGLTGGTALATLAELLRRWGPFAKLRPTGGTMTISIVGDLNPATVHTFRGLDCDGQTILFQGTPTTTRSGTITAITPLNQSANQAWEITDVAMAGTWTTDLTARIRITSGPRAGAIAWVAKDLGSKTARVSRFAHQAFYGANPTFDAPQVGDPYVVEHLPTINIGLVNPFGEYNNAGSTASFYFIDLDCVTPPYVYSTSVDVEFINSRMHGVWAFSTPQFFIENCCITASTATDYTAYLVDFEGSIEAGLLWTVAPAVDPTVNLYGGSLAINGLTSQNMQTFAALNGGVMTVSDLGIFDSTLQFTGDGSFIVGPASSVTCSFSGGNSIYGSGNAKGLFTIDVGGLVNLNAVPAFTFGGGDFAFFPSLVNGRGWCNVPGQYGPPVANTWANLSTFGSLHAPDIRASITLAGAGNTLNFGAGITANRPGSPFAGEMYFDTTLGTAFWWDGTVWVQGGIGLKVCTLEEFGAVGDGTTSDQAAFVAALAAIGAGTSFKTLLLGARNYRVTGNLSVPANCSIVGFGETSIISTITDAPVLLVDLAEQVTLSNFTILGNGGGGTGSQHGIACGSLGGGGQARLRIDNVQISACYKCFLFSGNNGGADGPIVTNCRAKGSYGFYTDTSSEFITFVNCHAYQCNRGIHIGSGNISWTGGTLNYNNINVEIAAGSNDSHGIITGAHIDHASSDAVNCGAIANGFKFVGCNIYDGNITISGNAKSVDFVGCTIDITNFAFTNSLARFLDCTIDTSYFVSYTDTGTADTEWKNTRSMAGPVPSYVATRVHQSYTFPADANQTLSAQLSRAESIVVAPGPISTGRTLTSTQAAASRWTTLLVNNTPFTLTFAWATGLGVSLAAGQRAVIGSDGTDAIFLLGGTVGTSVSRRSSAVTTTLVSGKDYHVSITAPGQIAKLPTSPANGEEFRVKAAYAVAGNTTIQALSGPNTVEGAASFLIGPGASATLCFNADTSDWEDC